MARVIPSGGSDQTSFFMARNAAAEDALTRLYMSLLAKRQDRDRNEAFQKEMAGIQQKHRLALQDNQYEPQKPAGPNPMGRPGAAANPQAGAKPAAAPPMATPPAPAPAPVAAPAAAPPPPTPRSRPGYAPGPMIPGSVAPPSHQRFGGNPANTPQENALAQVFMPPDDEQVTASLESGNASPGDDMEVSAQSRVPKKPEIPGQKGRLKHEPGTIKRTPKNPQYVKAGFNYIHPQWLDLMDQTEQKYGLPKGSLLTVYGYEHSGGSNMNDNPKSSARGLFHFTDPLRKDHGIRDEDINNPAVMIEAAGKNLRHNANQYKKLSGEDMPTEPESIPLWVALHNLGSGDGPRVVHAHLKGSGHMPMHKVMISSPTRNNQKVLVNNGLSSVSTVDSALGVIATKAMPWYERSHTLREEQEANPQPDSDADPNAPRPPADVPEGSHTQPVGPFTVIRKGQQMSGVLPQVQSLIDEFQTRYPKARITSGYRDPGRNERAGGAKKSQHIQRTAFDFTMNGYSEREQSDAIDFLRSKGVRGYGNYGGTSFHADLRKGPIAVWGPNYSRTSLPQTPRWFQAKAADIFAGKQPPAIAQPTPPSPNPMLPSTIGMPRPRPGDAPTPQQAPAVAAAQPAEPELPPMTPMELAGIDGSKDVLRGRMQGVSGAPLAVSTMFGGSVPNPAIQPNTIPRINDVAKALPQNVPMPEPRPRSYTEAPDILPAEPLPPPSEWQELPKQEEPYTQGRGLSLSDGPVTHPRNIPMSAPPPMPVPRPTDGFGDTPQAEYPDNSFGYDVPTPPSPSEGVPMSSQPFSIDGWTANVPMPTPPPDAGSAGASSDWTVGDWTIGTPPDAATPLPQPSLQGGDWVTGDQINAPTPTPQPVAPTKSSIASAIFGGGMRGVDPDDQVNGSSGIGRYIPSITDLYKKFTGEGVPDDGRDAQWEEIERKKKFDQANYDYAQRVRNEKIVPKGVKTEYIGDPPPPPQQPTAASATAAPTRQSEPTPPTPPAVKGAPAATGLPEYEVPPIKLEPKPGSKQENTPAFTGAPVGAGTPNINTGKPAANPASNMVIDGKPVTEDERRMPDGKGGFVYRKPDEIRAYRKSKGG